MIACFLPRFFLDSVAIYRLKKNNNHIRQDSRQRPMSTLPIDTNIVSNTKKKNSYVVHSNMQTIFFFFMYLSNRLFSYCDYRLFDFHLIIKQQQLKKFPPSIRLPLLLIHIRISSFSSTNRNCASSEFMCVCVWLILISLTFCQTTEKLLSNYGFKIE